MSAAGNDKTPGDLITEYLDQLRAGLRVAPGEAELIVAEAEDHLRETAAAAMAIGMTEREAQEAAISSFGPVRAVARAHEARGRAAALAGDAAAAAWKLVSLLLAVSGVSGLATDAIWAMIRMPHPIVILPDGSRPIVSPATQFIPIFYRPHFLVSVAVLVCAAILLAGYRLAGRRRQHRGRLRGPLSAGAFPAVAAGFFCAVTLALLAFRYGDPGAPTVSGLFIVACLALAIGYAARAARAVRRRRRRELGARQVA
jgi:hypothetical protein